MTLKNPVPLKNWVSLKQMKPKDFHLLSPSIIFPLKEGNPKDHRPDVFLVSPSMCFFPLNTQGLEPCLRFTKIFDSRREPVEKQGDTRFKTVNLVNTGESQMADNRFPSGKPDLADRKAGA